MQFTKKRNTLNTKFERVSFNIKLSETCITDNKQI